MAVDDVSQLRPCRFPIVGIVAPADPGVDIAAIVCGVVALVLPQRLGHHLVHEICDRRWIYRTRERQVVHVLNAAAPMLDPETRDRASDSIGLERIDQIRAWIEKNPVSICISIRIFPFGTL